MLLSSPSAVSCCCSLLFPFSLILNSRTPFPGILSFSVFSFLVSLCCCCCSHCSISDRALLLAHITVHSLRAKEQKVEEKGEVEEERECVSPTHTHPHTHTPAPYTRTHTHIECSSSNAFSFFCCTSLSLFFRFRFRSLSRSLRQIIRQHPEQQTAAPC